MKQTLQIMHTLLQPVALDENASGLKLYDDIYACEKNDGSKFAWLVDENSSLCKFIDAIGEADSESENSPLDLYNFYTAYNIKFPAKTVWLISEYHNINATINDMAGLIAAIVSPKEKHLQHAVFLDSEARPLPELITLRRRILQQFVYLRMFLPVIIAKSFIDAGVQFLHMLTHRRKGRRIYVFGAKNSGKSTVINAMLGADYLPGSPELPTPCNVECSEGKGKSDITLDKGTETLTFENAESLYRYLEAEFLRTDVSDTMRLTLPLFPEKLRGLTIIDTPGPNFAGAVGHKNITASALNEAEQGIFVMNYSSHLTHDEAELLSQAAEKFAGKTLLIALNRIDEMYAAEVVKSYERASDYIASRIRPLGHEDFLIIPVSAMITVYTRRLGGIISSRLGNIEARFSSVRKNYKGSDRKELVSFIDDKLKKMRVFHGREVRSIHELSETGRIRYFVHLVNSLC